MKNQAKNKDIINDLSESQILQIHQSLEDVKKGVFFTNDQIKKEAKEWLTR
jgi:uncharacterized protein YktB (UPF0637 family)